MEQLIFLLIIYGLYMLFNALMRRVQGPQQPSAQKRRQRQPGTPAPREAEEIPDILKKLLGIEEPEFVPPPEPRPVSPEDSNAEVPAETEPVSKPEAAGLETVIRRSAPTPVRKRRPPKAKKLLNSRKNIRNAFVLKEILEAPVSMRRREFPIAR